MSLGLIRYPHLILRSQYRSSYHCFSLHWPGRIEGTLSSVNESTFPDDQLIFLYGSILLELVMTTTQVVRDSHVKGPTEKVGDRYGSFALIIL
jgi:hypothetical protein